MLLKTAIGEVSGLRYMVDKLEIQSSLAKRVLLSTEFITQTNALETELNHVQQMLTALDNPIQVNAIDKITIKLMQIRDIHGSIKNLAGTNILDDIELFEVKSMALLANDIKKFLTEAEINIVNLPDLTKVIELLDPEKTRIPSFYIYDTYSSALGALRKQIKQKKSEVEQQRQENSINLPSLEKELEQTRYQVTQVEDEVRQAISAKLREHHEALKHALDTIATLDIIIAKAKQAKAMGLCKPTISKEKTTFRGIFYPQLKDMHQEQGKRYQPIDIELESNPCLITGANMAGKTVVLKTVALSQYLFQFGFFIPAAEAIICPVKAILFSLDDEQSELSGLSSFAAEMLKINHIIKSAKSNHNILVLIDELARTTNPYEGRAIVTAVTNILTEHHVRSLITTHYSNLGTSCHKLRVKGFMENHASGTITKENIGEFIDYSLVEDDGSTVPQEALKIAEILGVDAEIIEKAQAEIVRNKETTKE
ncbi:lysine 5,6-aminomutase reactivase ATPase KamC [Williamwhitmania taraxaci]|uniref:MutS domain V n=1 Tax=Williamwhitmania taraxaci TaxID=1640674 RepID=A0A1G6ID63_9BACT|nr:hypothetical protein [Williamwhitmania taraxaci]SDC04424.1 MutS domain V [Williamwhitmania taraxaci]